jgi:hypothetical protein
MSKEKQILKILKSWRFVFLFLMVYPFVSIIQNLFSNANHIIENEATTTTKIISCVFAGFVIYYLFTDRKKVGLNTELLIISIIYILTIPASAFLQHFFAPITFNILQVLLPIYGIIYLNTKNYKTYLSKMKNSEFNELHFNKEGAQKGNMLNRMATWALVLIPFIGLGFYFLSVTKSPLINILSPILIVLLLAAFLIVFIMAIVNFIASFKQLLTKKKIK